jgi:uracil-DNA glycosylase
MENKNCPICGKIHEWKSSSYFNEGIIKEIAFVFSCPGRVEKKSGYPVSGETGKTFDRLLEMLKENQIIDGYSCRYDFRITNATQEEEFKSETGKTEAKDKDVVESKNTQRLYDEIKDFKTIICFGKKAQLALSKIENKLQKGTGIINVRHLSQMAFINEKPELKERESRALYVYQEIKNGYQKP